MQLARYVAKRLLWMVPSLLGITLVTGLIIWCKADAERRGKSIPGVVPLAMVVTWPLAVPIYLVWTRGWIRGSLAAAGFVIVFALLFGGASSVAAAWAGG